MYFAHRLLSCAGAAMGIVFFRRAAYAKVKVRGTLFPAATGYKIITAVVTTMASALISTKHSVKNTHFKFSGCHYQ
jgi:hypothetical protein